VEMNFVSRFFLGLTQLFELLPSPLPNLHLCHHLVFNNFGPMARLPDTQFLPDRPPKLSREQELSQKGMLSWLRPDDVPDAQPKNNDHVKESRQHATCSCTTRNGKPMERRRCKIHQHATPASNKHHVEGKRQHAICSCKTRSGNPKEARRCKIHQKSTMPIQSQVVPIQSRFSLSLSLSLSFSRSLYFALSHSLCRSLALSLSRSLLLLSSLFRSPRSLFCSPFSLSRALCPVSLSSSVLHALHVHSYTCAKL